LATKEGKKVKLKNLCFVFFYFLNLISCLIKLLRSQKEKLDLSENEKFTHTPKINRKDLSQIFDCGNSIHKDFYSKNHIIRLDNARRDIDEKQKRLNWTNNNNKNNSAKHIRSISMELICSDGYLKGNDNNNNNNNSAIKNLQKTLRESLSSINLQKNDNEDDDFYNY
jgi:hypothetical protein